MRVLSWLLFQHFTDIAIPDKASDSVIGQSHRRRTIMYAFLRDLHLALPATLSEIAI